MAAVSRTALIVGAGIGGLAAAVALQREGWNVRVFERAAHAGELGFALLLASNAMASLQRLELEQPVIAGGASPDTGEIRGSGGRLMRRIHLGQIRHLLTHQPVVVLRAVLHGVLLAAAGRENVALGSVATGFQLRDRTAVLQLADGRTVESDVLVGADGVGSVIRKQLHPGEPPPRRSGLWAVRGVAHEIEPHLAEIDGAQYFGRGVEGGVARAAPRSVYWYLSVPGRQLGGTSEPAAIARRCAADFDDRFQRIVAATAPHEMRLDELLDRDPISDWGRGPVTLLGDAAHPMLPHAGQGAAQALEDAVALGRVLREEVDVGVALRRYERVRAMRTRRIVLLARRNARLGSITNPVLRWLRDAAIRTVPASALHKTYVEFGRPPDVEEGPGPSS
jgi:2-polyprenyl-6-methoxyphenol hydroxylase-like FAD-dependent oxidoreductase